jgi:hypothetical protein
MWRYGTTPSPSTSGRCISPTSAQRGHRHPGNIDAIRALTGFEDAEASIEATNRSLGITTVFLPGTTRPVPHVMEGEHPGRAAVRAAHAGFASVGFKGSEEPTSDDGSEMGDA